MMKKLIYIIPILAGLVVTLLIWNNPEDSRQLPKKLQEANDQLRTGNCESAKIIAAEVISDARNPNNIGFAENIIGYCWFIEGDLDSSYYHYVRSLNALNEADSTDYKLKAITYNMIGYIFEHLEEHNKAIEYMTKSVNILEEYPSKQIYHVYYNLAVNQSKVNDISCVKTFYKALEYATKYENSYFEMRCLKQLGNLMLETNNYDAAIEYYNNALLTDHAKKDSMLTSFCYQGLGEAYYHLNKQNLSEENLNKALRIKKKLKNQSFVFTSKLYLARLRQKQGRLEAAEKAYYEAIEFFPLADHTRENIAVYKELAKVQMELGKYDESSHSNYLHYEEIEKYLDEREKAAQLAKQDDFDVTVAAKESQFRNNSVREVFKDEFDWGLLMTRINITLGLFLIMLYLEQTRRRSRPAPTT